MYLLNMDVFYIISSYLFGSLCSAIIVSKSFNLSDPRTSGSQNPGATNVWRISGQKYAIFVLLCDISKGFLPVFMGKLLGIHAIIVGFIGMFAVIGHIYPIFFSFKGGKGVATFLGMLLALNYILGLYSVLVLLLLLMYSKYMSLSAILTLVFVCSYVMIYLHDTVLFLQLFCLSVLIIYKHKDNIIRLLNKTESKVKF